MSHVENGAAWVLRRGLHNPAESISTPIGDSSKMRSYWDGPVQNSSFFDPNTKTFTKWPPAATGRGVGRVVDVVLPTHQHPNTERPQNVFISDDFRLRYLL